jgi:hypothetical protein
LVCVPKEDGGLSVINLRVQNESLLLKHLHKFYNHVDTPWVQMVWNKYYSGNRLPSLQGPQKGSFWWHDALKLQQQFKGIASVTLHNGATYLLWHDLWVGHVWSQACPELFSFSKTPNMTIQVAAQAPQFQDMFYLPLSPEAYAQFLISQWPSMTFNFKQLRMCGVICRALLPFPLIKHISS